MLNQGICHTLYICDIRFHHGVYFFSLSSLFVGPALFSLYALFFAVLCRWFNVTLTMLTRCSSLLVRSFFSHIFMFGVCHRRAVCWFILFVRHLTLAHFRWVGRSMLHLFFPHCALDTHNMFYIIQILNKHRNQCEWQWQAGERKKQQPSGTLYMASARLAVRKRVFIHIVCIKILCNWESVLL